MTQATRLAIARGYNEAGADEITFLDITASSDNRDTTYSMVEQVASGLFIPLTVGGGIRAVSDVRRLLNAGADKVSINTAAVHNPELVQEASDKVGSQCIVVAIDSKCVSKAGTNLVGKYSLTVVASQLASTPLSGL